MKLNDKEAITFIKQTINKILKQQPAIVIGIDGMAASGKSNLASLLAKAYKATIIHMDDFFLQDHQRTNARLSETDGFIDYERFNKEVLQPLKNKKSFTYQKYNCQTKTMSSEFVSNDCEVYIIEGAYALRDAFQEIYDLKVLMLIDEDKQLSRIKTRNHPSLVTRFKTEWIPRENRYIKEYNLESLADIVIKVK